MFLSVMGCGLVGLMIVIEFINLYRIISSFPNNFINTIECELVFEQ